MPCQIKTGDPEKGIYYIFFEECCTMHAFEIVSGFRCWSALLCCLTKGWMGFDEEKRRSLISRRDRVDARRDRSINVSGSWNSFWKDDNWYWKLKKETVIYNDVMYNDQTHRILDEHYFSIFILILRFKNKTKSKISRL